MNLYKALFFFLFAGLIFTACKSSKNNASNIAPADNGIFQPFDFEALSIRSKLRFENAGKESKATAHIRIRKDSAIWVSVSKTSVEGARILVTPDTIMAIDRLNKLYYTYSYQELQERFNFAFDYKMLESALTGEPYAPHEQVSGADFKKKRKFYLLEKTLGTLLVKQFVSKSNQKLTRVEAVDAMENELLVEYDAFEAIEKQLFPHHNTATIHYTKNGVTDTTTIDLEYQKVSKEEADLRLPFKINSKYEEGE